MQTKPAACPTNPGANERPAHAPPPPANTDLDEALDRVFLTPRVVDQRTFDELAGSLRSVAKDAIAQARALAATTGEVKLLGNHLSQATQDLDQRVQTAVRVIPTLDQRIQRAEQLLEQATATASRTQPTPVAVGPTTTTDVESLVRSALERVVEEQLAAFRDRLEQSARAVQSEIEARAAGLTDRLGEAHEQVRAAFSQAEDRTHALTNRLVESCVQATRTHEALLEAQAGAGDTAERPGAAKGGVGPGSATAQAVASQELRSLILTAGKACDACAQAASQLEAIRVTVAGELGSFEEAAAEGAARVDALRAQLDELLKASSTLASDEYTARLAHLRQVGASLSELIAQGDQIGRGLTRVIADARHVLERSRP